jgi:hypothetical protein
VGHSGALLTVRCLPHTMNPLGSGGCWYSLGYTQINKRGIDLTDGERRPVAFVLIPFQPEFDRIFEQIIKPCIEDRFFRSAPVDVSSVSLIAAITEGNTSRSASGESCDKKSPRPWKLASPPITVNPPPLTAVLIRVDPAANSQRGRTNLQHLLP